MWHYTWHWHVAHGVITETCSCGWGWYVVLVVILVTNVVLQVRRHK